MCKIYGNEFLWIKNIKLDKSVIYFIVKRKENIYFKNKWESCINLKCRREGKGNLIYKKEFWLNFLKFRKGQSSMLLYFGNLAYCVGDLINSLTHPSNDVYHSHFVCRFWFLFFFLGPFPSVYLKSRLTCGCKLQFEKDRGRERPRLVVVVVFMATLPSFLSPSLPRLPRLPSQAPLRPSLFICISPTRSNINPRSFRTPFLVVASSTQSFDDFSSKRSRPNSSKVSIFWIVRMLYNFDLHVNFSITPCCMLQYLILLFFFGFCYFVIGCPQFLSLPSMNWIGKFRTWLVLFLVCMLIKMRGHLRLAWYTIPIQIKPNGLLNQLSI